ncbi:Leucine-rich repeat-containing protein, partial [Cynara cardunculus var. scolymus]
ITRRDSTRFVSLEKHGGANSLKTSSQESYYHHAWEILVRWHDSNMLISTIPSNLWSHKTLVVLNFIGGYQMLNKLSLAHNRLQGSTPKSLGTVKSLQLLDLSHNNLSGEIPS